MQVELFNDDNNNGNFYSKKVVPPQYVPKRDAPDISELCCTTKYGELKRNILASSVTDE